jgi:hypothetical protein
VGTSSDRAADCAVDCAVARGRFVFDARAKYSGCGIDPAEYAVDIGGPTLGGGLEIRL